MAAMVYPDGRIDCRWPRMYYTSAEAAAWMAERFGLRFDPCGPERWYVTAATFWLLEPQVGDWYVSVEGRGAISDVGQVFYCRIALRDYPQLKPAIIARKGVEFIWPERDESQTY